MSIIESRDALARRRGFHAVGKVLPETFRIPHFTPASPARLDFEREPRAGFGAEPSV